MNVYHVCTILMLLVTLWERGSCIEWLYFICTQEVNKGYPQDIIFKIFKDLWHLGSTGGLFNKMANTIADKRKLQRTGEGVNIFNQLWNAMNPVLDRGLCDQWPI